MSFPLLAVDVGNARMKIGVFGPFLGNALPEPIRTLPLDGDAPEFDSIVPWLDELASEKLPWFLASVNRAGASRLIDWVRGQGRAMP